MGQQEKMVLKKLRENMLVDGYPILMDMRRSYGNIIYDALANVEYVDFFTSYASIPISYNHPKMIEEEFVRKIGQTSLIKVANSDIYTREFAKAVFAFKKFAMPDYLKYIFFISGGALAVENALKAAFDWKFRKNWQKGFSKEKIIGNKIIHFKEAFHGRSGYTMSLTNTDPLKIYGFPQFKWPRIDNPKIRFPMEDNIELIKIAEQKALKQIQDIIRNEEPNIAGLIIEPIQGEGGDNHFRKEFFQELQQLTLENDILFIVDEIQTGMGVTGKVWAHQHFGVKPDIVCFGKKSQICGILAGNRLDEVNEHVFKQSSRINSTWGGNIVDAVRLEKYIEIIEEQNLLQNAEIQGKYLLSELLKLQNLFPDIISNVRGLGLLVAVDLPNKKYRNKVLDLLFQKHFIFLPCGQLSIRFRPMLDINKEQIDLAINAWNQVLDELTHQKQNTSLVQNNIQTGTHGPVCI